MVKLIATDLDGTLLNNEGQISIYSKTVLEKCMELGIKIAFATARPIRATTIFYPTVKPDAIICHNGAYVIIDNKIIAKHNIKYDLVSEIIGKINQLFIEYKLIVEVNDKMYTNFDPNLYWDNLEFESINNMPYIDADKIIVGINDVDELMKIKSLLPDELYFEKDTGTKGGVIGLIINKEAKKWNGIKELQHYYKINDNEVIVFGDNENDYEMIKNCKIGISVNNAIDEIKKISKYVCENNNDDGVAKWIEKNVL